MTRLASRSYRRLLRLLPRAFRASYGEEMEEAFLESMAVAKRRAGRMGGLIAFVRAAVDLILTAVRLRKRRSPPPRRLEPSSSGWLQDFRLALRRLARTPGFALPAILTLALGTGATLVIFTVVDAVLLRPLPYAEPDRLVAVFLNELEHGGFRSPTSPFNFFAWESESESLELMTAAHPWSPSLTGRDRPAELHGLKVSTRLFQLLGAAPLHGRTFTESDEGEPVVVLGYDLWRRIGGGALVLDGLRHTVIGVMPEGFRFPPFWSVAAEMWTPLSFTPESAARHSRYLRVFARLKEGISIQEARAEMEGIGARLAAQVPDRNARTTVNVEPLQEPVVSESRPALVLLLAAVVLLALIACANVANLQLVRDTSRAKEIALEIALGAGRMRLLRRRILESLILSLSGGFLGAAAAGAGVPLVLAMAPEGLPRLSEIAMDGRVYAFSLFLSLSVAVLLAIAGASRAIGSSPGARLREASTRTTDARGRSLRDGLVIGQVAISVVLLVAAGLVVRSFLELRAIDPGFRRQELLTSSLLLAGSPHAEPERQVLLFRRIRETVGALPGVRNAAFVNHLPIGGDSWGVSFDFGDRVEEAERSRATRRTATPGYFRTMGTPLLAGRDFVEEDDGSSAPVVIVNRSLAERYLSLESIVGRRIRLGDDDWRRVVGVVGDSRHWELAKDVSPEIYFPYSQNPDSTYLTTTLVVASETPPDRLQPLIEQAVWSVAGEIPVVNVRTMESILAEQVAPQRFTSLLFTCFALLALLLAAVGLYGVLSYTVSRQTVEMGIRSALGASNGDLAALVLMRGLRLLGMGLAAGLAGALLASRLLSSLLFGVSARDPVTFLLVGVFLTAVFLVSMGLPARRAAKLDPLRALRAE